MKQFTIHGIEATTGAERILEVQADTKDDAARIARVQGVFPTAVAESRDEVPSSAFRSKEANDSARKLLYWSLAGLFGVTLLFIAAKIFLRDRSTLSPIASVTKPHSILSESDAVPTEDNRTAIEFAIELKLIEFENTIAQAIAMLDNTESEYQMISLREPIKPYFIGSEYFGADEHREWNDERRLFVMQNSEAIHLLNQGI